MNKHNKHYQQLTRAERYQIWALRDTGKTLREIAQSVGVHFSTVSRELSRNRTANSYDPVVAHKLSRNRKREAAKTNKHSDKLDKIIRDKVILNWSPEAISERIQLEMAEDDWLSHTTIYRRIEENKQQGGTLYRFLPRFGKTRWKGGKRNRNAGVSLIPDRTDIKERPKVVDDRSRLGDWEGDTVHGQNAHLVTLVDRASRFTLVKRVFDKTNTIPS